MASTVASPASHPGPLTTTGTALGEFGRGGRPDPTRSPATAMPEGRRVADHSPSAGRLPEPHTFHVPVAAHGGDQTVVAIDPVVKTAHGAGQATALRWLHAQDGATGPVANRVEGSPHWPGHPQVVDRDVAVVNAATASLPRNARPSGLRWPDRGSSMTIGSHQCQPALPGRQDWHRVATKLATPPGPGRSQLSSDMATGPSGLSSV